MAPSTKDEVHTDSEGELDHSFPNPPLSPNRPPGDDSSHIDADSDRSSDTDEEGDDRGRQAAPPPPPQNARKDIPVQIGNFRLLTKIKIEGSEIRVAKWQSEKSGLKVVWADTPDLISSFATTVVTECFDSSGVPHTLEHLTFTASKHYPYSNVLDSVANRLFTSGTNAETAVDHTTYTFDSASAEGLLETVPVFLDHILFPLFTPESFKTEIYHVDGNGEEGGTVFSEMQGLEGSQDEVMMLARKQCLYNFHNAYRYETGGMLPHLRHLTLDKIVEYHKTAYVPQNMTVVVLGQSVDPEELLSTISQTTERHIAAAGLARGPHPQDWIRPFVESTTSRYEPLLEKDKVVNVPFASSDSSGTGSISITWIGPPCHDFLTNTALDVMGDYLCGTDTSILNKHFVEVANPACTGIGFEVDFRNPLILNLVFEGVAKDRLQDLAHHVKLTLKMACVCKADFDIKRIKVILEQQRIALEKMLERNSVAYCQENIMQDIIYGAENGSQLKDVFGDLTLLKELEKWNLQDWIELLEDWFVERHSLGLIGTPSPDLAKSQAKSNADRVSKNREKYGSTGLATLAKDLEEAEEKNHHPPPPSLVEGFVVPDVRDFTWIKVDTARSNGVGQGTETFHGPLQQAIDRDGFKLPYFVQFDDYESKFVKVSIYLHGPPPLALTPLYINTFFSMPVKRANGQRLEWQEVSRQLDKIFSSCVAETLNEGILVSLTALKEDYVEAIEWLGDIIFGTIFDVERLKTIVQGQIQSFPAAKEDGGGIASSALDYLVTPKQSLGTWTNSIRRFDDLPELQKRLEQDPQSVVAELEAFEKTLLNPRSMRMSVIGNIVDTEKPSSSWLEHFEPLEAFPINELVHTLRTRDLQPRVRGSKALVYELDNTESSYLCAAARSPDWSYPDYAALELAATVLSATNGPLWSVTRTAGLCYGSSIENQVEHGLIRLGIDRSPDAIVALAAIRKLLESIVKGTTTISTVDLAAAKSQLIFVEVAGKRTPHDVASDSFLDTVILNRPRHFTKRYLAQIELVTVEDIVRVIRTWVLPLLRPATSVISASTGSTKKKALVDGLTKLGYNVEERHF